MFQDASAFNQPLGDWDLSSVTNDDDMLKNAGCEGCAGCAQTCLCACQVCVTPTAAPTPSPTGAQGFQVDDSGWFAVQSDQTYTRTHGLGAVPMSGTIWASEYSTGDEALMVDAVYSSGAAFGTILTTVTGSDYTIRTGTGCIGFVANGDCKIWDSGYLRVVLSLCPDGAQCDDSSWFAVSKDQTYTRTHGLG